MTDEQAKQYEICKIRHHEEYPRTPVNPQDYQSQGMQAAQTGTWKLCRYCGTQYQDVTVPRQIERAQQAV